MHQSPKLQNLQRPEDALLEEAEFSAVLTAHRSLSQRGFIILMAAISAVSFAAGYYFFTLGAWPVPGFFGLDVLLIYIAFKLNYRAGRAFEAVNLIDHELILTKVDPNGRVKNYTFNPRWVTFEVEERPGERIELSLSSHGRTTRFAANLTSEEKRDFAQALRGALARYRAA